MTDPEQIKAWRRAIAEHRRQQRNKRGRRSTDPYRYAQPVIYRPAPPPRRQPDDQSGDPK